MTSPADQPLPTRLAAALGDAYTIEGEIGRGGMGVVYRARDERLQRRVAIKVLPPELAFQEDIRQRFTREAQTAARLSHPHIVPIHTVGEGMGLVYFVMGYVDGESVAARIRRRGKLPVDEVRRFDDPAHRRRLSVKPGLTCLWQVSGRNNVNNFREWVRLDLEYIDNWSLWLDLKILWRTIPVVLAGTGAK